VRTLKTYQGTPQQLQKGKKMLESLLDKGVGKSKKESSRYEIYYEGNLMHVALIETSKGKTNKQIRKDVKELKKKP
jgi:hypothetical protein